MKYLSTEHRILRYFGKLDGWVSVAHMKCLKPQGSDYAKLLDIENRRKRGEDISEVIPLTDAEFDMAKVRALFVERFGDTPAQFDTAAATLRSTGYLDAVKAAATKKCRDKHVEVETLRKAKMVEIGLTEEMQAKTAPSLSKLNELEALDFKL